MGFDLREFLKFIRIEHSSFDLPFAYMGVLLAGVFSVKVLILVGIAGISARTSGMIINRLMDLPLDRINPRTAERALVTGKISLREAKAALVASSSIFVIVAFSINTLAGILSPIVILFFYLYPLTKKIHAISHYVLGFSIGLIVLAGYVAGKDAFPGSVRPYLLMIFVSLWISAFDILYQNSDYLFDTSMGMKTIPVLCRGRVDIPAVVTFFGALVSFTFFSFPSILLIIMVLIVAAIITVQMALWRKGDPEFKDKVMMKFNFPIPFIIVSFLILYVLLG
ncbi:MAG: putative 4-hydroxybenzoate polyprenyltransferase [Candidatus Thermoplasmatota archaeon]|jgi:4-hydroxybenzoate polyprenyltransferase|nr:putative 4-hydroxybenzoate polyprenyltransferase [Candidatus Thermoplasmatota archaeon]